ncbi:tyrosine-type recombinase/integrase [Streptomyces sp. 7N604]|uniref:tyrosine-type recombinase/integrase n=1 Tax=Streptomyces sp. 7N604 TaxID=3457415 RepID=UPI003FD1B49A
MALHDLRHLAATLTITAGVPLAVVSKTLRHSTLSTTANIYAHLTQQAARSPVDAIDTALTKAERDGHRRHWPNWLRPHHDHQDQPDNQRKPAYSPTTAASSPTASQPQGTSATTLRPPTCERDKGRSLIRKRPLACENTVGTTGFEPATP